MNKIQIIVLAAGHGKRMNNNDLPKVLVPLKEKPMIKYLLEAIAKSGICQKPVIVVGNKAEQIKTILGPDYSYVFQAEQLGTGHAVLCCKEMLENNAESIMVLYGDHPFVSAEMISKLAQTHLDQNAVLTMATVKVPDFEDWRKDFMGFGRIIRDEKNEIIKIIENKDATEEQRQIKELNPAYFCFKSEFLWAALDSLKNDNVQHEYYLTDLVSMAFSQNKKIATFQIKPEEALGVNTAEQLELLENLKLYW